MLLNLAFACRSAEVADPVRLLNLLPVVAAGWLPFRQNLGRSWQGGCGDQQGSEQETAGSEHGSYKQGHQYGRSGQLDENISQSKERLLQIRGALHPFTESALSHLKRRPSVLPQ